MYRFNESFNEESEEDARADAKLFLEEAKLFKSDEVNDFRYLKIFRFLN